MSTGYRLYQMTVAELEQFNRINSLIARGITAAVKEGAGTKSDEGSMIIRFPPMYDLGAPNSVEVQLTLYVFGPTRHYKWNGFTLQDCLDQVERDINKWLTDEKLLPVEDICHVLHLGRVLCGFTMDEPAQWPEGQHWVSLVDALTHAKSDVTCPECQKAVEAAQVKYERS